MGKTRRDFFRNAFLGAGVLAGTSGMAAQQSHPTPPEHMDMNMDHGAMKMGQKSPDMRAATGGAIVPVETPDVPKLPWTMENDLKVFHLVAEPVKREFVPGRLVDTWGYNGSVPGPTIEVTQGDRVRIIVENRLPEATSMHWHGFEIPIPMDGVPGISQDPIPPGGRFTYEFTLHQEGTFFYHSHMAMQEMMGMIGLFVMHPKQAYTPRVDKDFGLILQEWAILPNNSVPNTLSMEFNWLTMNGKAAPATTPLIVKLGDRVRIRVANLGMDHHPIHLHGNTFNVTGTEGGRAPQSTWRPENTVLVGVAQAREIEFEAKYPGDWMLHCHMPHHMMNQMASMVGPLAESGTGIRAGKGMGEGMGMLRQGSALSKENGPSLGRSIGIGADFEKATTNMQLQPQTDMKNMGHDMQQMGHEISGAGKSQSDPWLVPGYPQDMFMPMDEMVVKPENYGLRKNWTGGMMGMMTLVRVLPPDLYDKVMALVKKHPKEEPAMPMEMHHHHMPEQH